MRVIGEHYEARQLVFVDESATDRRTARRGYGWAPTGTRARRRDFFVRGKRQVLCALRPSHPPKCNVRLFRYSILPAMSLDGILALDVKENAYAREDFIDFLHVLLRNMNPFPESNSVIIMDNASIHKGPEIRELIEDR